MERTYYDGQPIRFVDPQGAHHDALVTRWWCWNGERYTIPDAAWVQANGEPGCNLVYVTSDKSKEDPYGLQLERATSVTHQTKQAAPGNFWYWPGT